MVNGLSYYLKKFWKSSGREEWQPRMIEWRAGNSVVKLSRPTRLDRAHALGYKAKQGVVVVRVRVNRGGRQNSLKKKGRKSTRLSNKKILKMSYQWVAELRASKYFNNLEVIGSYFIGKDGQHYFFEVILVDPNSTSIKNDKELGWVAKRENWGRAERGLTSSARKSRGLGSKSHDLKVRPSLRAWKRLGK